MTFQTPNGNKILDTGNDRIRQPAASPKEDINLFEPSPTVEHLRTKNFKTTPIITTSNTTGRSSMGQKNIINDLEEKIVRRNNELYRPLQSAHNRADKSKRFREHTRERKNDKVIYNREFLNYKNSKEENERIMNEIARNMSLSIDDFDKAEQTIDAILGFSEEIYDPKSRPRYFDMVDEFVTNEDDLMTGDDFDEYNHVSNSNVRSPPSFVDPDEAIQRELEELLKLQEEELEYLTSNLSLS